MDIYPAHVLDNAQNYRKILMSYMFRFNDIPDGQQLVDSLLALLKIGDWRKLSGRFRLNENGKLEIHVPRHFTSEAPAITYSHQVFAASVDTHALGKWLPPPGHHSGVRQCSGLRDFVDIRLRNWSLVLNNRTGDVLPLVGARDDTLEELLVRDTGQAEESVLDKLSIGLLGSIVLLIRAIWMTLRDPGYERRVVILPQDEVSRLCVQARSDLKMQGGKELFISEADVLAAWAARMVAASQPRPRPVTIASVINLRFTLDTLRETSGEYIHNLLQLAYVPIAPGHTTAPLGITALAHRQQVTEQCTKSQTLAYIRMQRDHTKATGDLKLMFGSPRAAFLKVNNLIRLDFFHNIDFSSAVIPSDDPGIGVGTRQNPAGTIVDYFTLSLNQATIFTSDPCVLGKDHCGRIQMLGTF